jgi:uncharacterized protein (DUF302 family)
LIEAVAGRGLKVFAEIDHSGAAREVGLELQAERVVLFGSPQAGTPLMRSDPHIGIELPLRMLIWEDGDGALLGYNDPRELAAKYEIEQHHDTLENMSTLLASLASEAAG